MKNKRFDKNFTSICAISKPKRTLDPAKFHVMKDVIGFGRDVSREPFDVTSSSVDWRVFEPKAWSWNPHANLCRVSEFDLFLKKKKDTSRKKIFNVYYKIDSDEINKMINVLESDQEDEILRFYNSIKRET